MLGRRFVALSFFSSFLIGFGLRLLAPALKYDADVCLSAEYIEDFAQISRAGDARLCACIVCVYRAVRRPREEKP